ncbi:MAG: DNA repair exonuclease [Rhodobacteraceae bacterium]|nr:MAG: DNA repair exonuclease [Paracoccaceae bacterium]
MIRVLHTADIHLDSPLKSLALRDPELREQVQTASRTALTRIIDIALAEDVAALLIAGDLFDSAERSARTAAFLTLQLERLRAGGVRVFYIKGNHDAENPLTGEVTLPENVHVFDGRGGKVQLSEGVWVHGVSFASRHAPDSLLPKFPAPVEGAVNIAMLHTSLSGAEGHDPYAPCALSDLTAAGFDYWALGHVHRRQVHSEAPWVVMPGTPQGRDIGEPGPKTAALVTIGEGIRVEEAHTSALEFLPLQVDVTQTESDDALRDLLRQRLQEIARALVSDNAVIRLTLSGHTARRWQMLRDQDVWRDTVAQMARATGRLWLDKLVFDLSDSAAPGQSATDELAAIMTTIRGEPGFSAGLRADIEEVLQEFTPKQRAELLPDETAMDQLTQRLAATGAERLLARMKGASS